MIVNQDQAYQIVARGALFISQHFPFLPEDDKTKEIIVDINGDYLYFQDFESVPAHIIEVINPDLSTIFLEEEYPFDDPYSLP